MRAAFRFRRQPQPCFAVPRPRRRAGRQADALEQSQRRVDSDKLARGGGKGVSDRRIAAPPGAGRWRPGNAGVRKPAGMVPCRSGHHGCRLHHRSRLHHQYRARSYPYSGKFGRARGDRLVGQAGRAAFAGIDADRSCGTSGQHGTDQTRAAWRSGLSPVGQPFRRRRGHRARRHGPAHRRDRAR